MSGGENQRLKLVEELSKRLGDRSLYLLDNPCRGVGNGLVRAVGGALKDLIQKNNSVLVADNTMGLVALADWLVVLGPPAHTNGSLRLNIRYEGPPDEYDGDIWRL
jgi:excinuclease ABC subunit A